MIYVGTYDFEPPLCTLSHFSVRAGNDAFQTRGQAQHEGCENQVLKDHKGKLGTPKAFSLAPPHSLAHLGFRV